MSPNYLGNGTQTGVWLEEAAEPYVELSRQGAQTTVASPKGGAVPIDPRSKPTATQARLWQAAIESLEHSVPLSGLSSEDFDGISFPGGHGPMFDLAKDVQLALLLRDFATDQKPISVGVTVQQV